MGGHSWSWRPISSPDQPSGWHLSSRQPERAFLDRLIDAGEVEASLLTEDPGLQDRIAAQPMLRWKAMHVRRFHGVPTPESEGEDESV